jgi:hypothetical protein
MNRIAEFMGWRHLGEGCWGDVWETQDGERVTSQEFDPYEDANDTELVEARLREKGLWPQYVHHVCLLTKNKEVDMWSTAGAMAATKEQRKRTKRLICGVRLELWPPPKNRGCKRRWR